MAIALPDRAAGELDSALAPLRLAWPELRWTRRDAWHLTLAFLGEVEDRVTGDLAVRLERAAARHARLSLALGSAGAFPGAGNARVLWTGVQGDRRGLAARAASVAAGARRGGAAPASEGRGDETDLTRGGAGASPGAGNAGVLWPGGRGDGRGVGALAASVAAGARRAGAPPASEGRRYEPHLTLARCRVPADVRTLVATLADFTGTPWTASEIYLIRSRPQDEPRYETIGTWPLRARAASLPG